MSEAIICPTITASSVAQYSQQMHSIKTFAARVHIDYMDGQFTKAKSIALGKCWWYDYMNADLHLMHAKPDEILNDVIKLKPNLAIIHYEAKVKHVNYADALHASGIKAGLAILQGSKVSAAKALINYFDYVLIFSGHLGYQGGQADLKLLDKVSQVKQIKPTVEIAWDGGINDTNAKQLVERGVSVLNVGGYIQDSPDPFASYAKLKLAIR